MVDQLHLGVPHLEEHCVKGQDCVEFALGGRRRLEDVMKVEQQIEKRRTRWKGGYMGEEREVLTSSLICWGVVFGEEIWD